MCIGDVRHTKNADAVRQRYDNNINNCYYSKPDRLLRIERGERERESNEGYIRGSLCRSGNGCFLNTFSYGLSHHTHGAHHRTVSDRYRYEPIIAMHMHEQLLLMHMQ